ncbi:MAG: DUF5103 domain-containing protein [Paludibacteraceae bacterium]|nr:DUF5103 domain-containing protein [Paludibacteraceae bacterium]
MRVGICLIFGWLLCLPLWAGGHITGALQRNIRSVQVYNPGTSTRQPVISLGSNEQLVLSFDDLNSSQSTYSYRFYHCNRFGEVDDLSDSEFIDGFANGYLDEYLYSFNTYMTYTHYSLRFPNEDCRFKVSGNYLLRVFEDNDEDKPVLNAVFQVVEPKMEIQALATARTDISYQRDYQQVQLDLLYPNYRINSPDRELFVLVRQNGRYDNAVWVDSPNYVEHGKAVYRHHKNLIFEAGNTYRVFDISSQHVLSERVESITYHAPYYHVTLYPDELRTSREYDYIRDVAGRYRVNLQYSEHPEIEADYYFTHFNLPVGQALDGEVYLSGELTGWKLDEAARMSYNPQTQAYEHILLLKQGGYNYQYLFVPAGSGQAQTALIEGNKWQTANEYSIYVYHRSFGGRYDRLIGYQLIHANQQP